MAIKRKKKNREGEERTNKVWLMVHCIIRLEREKRKEKLEVKRFSKQIELVNRK